jgi:hypothetical protein
VSGNDYNAFKISTNSGVISIANPSALNFESNSNIFELDIEVEDTSSNFGGTSPVQSFITSDIAGTLGGNWSENSHAYIYSVAYGGTTAFLNASLITDNEIEIMFNETIASGQPDIRDFTVMEGGAPVNITNVTLDVKCSSCLVISVDSSVRLYNKYVTLSYNNFGPAKKKQQCCAYTCSGCCRKAID